MLSFVFIICRVTQLQSVVRAVASPLTILCPQKVVHQAHIDNFVNSQQIFKILLLINSLRNLGQNYH